MTRVGDVLDEWEFTVEAGKVREFARAVQDPHWRDGDIAPPTFPVVASAAFVERLVTEILRLDRSRTVHGEQEYVYERPMRVGDRLRCRATLTGDDVKTGKRGGRMRVIAVEVEFSSADTGEVICRELMRSIEKEAPST